MQLIKRVYQGGLRWAACMLLGVSPFCACAEWTYFSSLDGDTVLIDKTTLVQNKNRNATIWMLTNYGNITVQNVLSVSKWVEFDCDHNRFRYLAVYGYEGQMQTGAKLINMPKPSQWDKIYHGTVLKNVQLIACLRGPMLR